MIRQHVNFLPSAAALCLAALLPAQNPCYAENDGPAFGDGTSMGGPDLLLGVRFQPNVTDAVLGIQVFTGEGRGENSVALWTHDSASNQPGQPLGTGRFEMSRTNSWQGACLDQAVVITSGQTYWMVWGPQNSSQASVLDVQPGNGQVYRGSFDGARSWNGPWSDRQNHWKFRLLCPASTLPGSWTTMAAGCAGSTGSVPSVRCDNEPRINATLDVGLSAAAPAISGLLLIGQPLGMPLDLGLAGAPGCVLQGSTLFGLVTSTDAGGAARVQIPIPNDPQLRCGTVTAQAAFVDPGSNALGVSLSNAAAITIGG